MNPTVLQKWLSPESIAYVSECLQICENPQMLADLREFVPIEALRQATTRLSIKKRGEIKQWVVEQNSQKKEVAA